MITATLNDYRQSPRKVRLVGNLIKGKNAETALTLLTYTVKEAAGPIQKLLKSALANAKNTMKDGDVSALIVKNVEVNPGTTLKRSMPRARGSAFPIKKRTSHILLTLDMKAVKKNKPAKNK